MFSANLFLIILFASSSFFNLVSSHPLIGIRDDLSSEFVGVGLRDDVALSIHKRRVEKPTESPFCTEHRQTFEDYCNNMWTDRPSRIQNALFTFCPGYENRCLH
ncbi:hypothetical protein CRE_04512 [Caenorhabditis remanei]|uniref:Uncharacterized protein n=1 Tax=Caenorhabditis remanei TaxID=31234 RepID=E3LYS6_CAERE|nr:hypothetical protein CRE_04512 [Caenorhabditis remanei]